MAEFEQESTPGGDEKELKLWATLLHLSLLSGFVIPGIGSVIVPIVIYVLKKDDLPGILPHWYVVANWMISALIYCVAAIVLSVLTLGLLLPVMIIALWGLGIAHVVFVIIGAIKANDGEVWPYPLTIRILGREQ